MFSIASDPISLHLDRLHSRLLSGGSLDRVPEWVESNTRLRGAPFSFLHHEYQLRIARDPSPIKNIRKCSQVGISEFSVRSVLAAVNIVPGFTTIYTLPTANFATTFVKTRVDPVIQTSPALAASIDLNNDNTNVKQFGESFLYFRGTKGAAAAISVPADWLVHDELDFSDLEVVSNYQSRLTHSPYKFKTKFSTPTVEKYGISAEMDRSRRFYLFCKCNHCNFQFIPNYFTDVDIPDFEGDLREINKTNIHLYRTKEAVVRCPKCRLQPDLGPEYREWVCENPAADPDTAGYQISPFDAPFIITPGYLISASTTYSRYADFVNFGLGLPCEDAESSITPDDLNKMFKTASDGNVLAYVMGIDVGQTCHIMVGAVKPFGAMEVVHAEKVPHHQLERRKNELSIQYGVRITVMDSFPYFDMLLRMQTQDRNMWGAVFIQSRDLDLYQLKQREDDPTDAVPYIRQININRNKAFDGLMEAIRGGFVTVLENQEKQDISEQITDMKRIRALSDDGDHFFRWQKSEAKNDHYHHTMLYAWMASRMTGLSSYRFLMPTYVQTIALKKHGHV